MVLSTTNIAEGTNQYYTGVKADARVQAAIQDTVTGLNTVWSSTKISNEIAAVPQAVTSVNAQTGVVALDAYDIPFTVTTNTAQSITGSKTFTQRILGANGSIAGPSYGFLSETNSGIYKNGAGDVSIVKVGAEKFNVGASENTSLQTLTMGNGTNLNFVDTSNRIRKGGSNLQITSYGALTFNLSGSGGSIFIGPTLRKSSAGASANLGTSNQPWNTIIAVNPLVVTSDSRKKKNIVDHNTLGLGFVKKLQPKTYVFDDEMADCCTCMCDMSDCCCMTTTATHKRNRLGLIAQDVELAMNECGITTNDIDLVHNEKYDEDIPLADRTDKYMMSYEVLIPTLINAIKELEVKVAALEAHHP